MPSGTARHDWTVNDEWNVRDAWIADATRSPGGRLQGAQPAPGQLQRPRARADDARRAAAAPVHPARAPGLDPYRTSYYHRTWGFCLSQRQLDAMGEGPYEVVVDTTLGARRADVRRGRDPRGHRRGGPHHRARVPSRRWPTTTCPASSSPSSWRAALAALPRRLFTYRFVFAPGTIGSLTWLSQHPELLDRIKHGLVLAGLGGPGPLVYKRTRRGDRTIDRAAAHVVSRQGGEVRDYSPYGYDERQYNSLGLQPAGRPALPHTARGVPGVPHVGRRPGLRQGRGACGRVRRVAGSSTSSRTTRAYLNLSPHGEPQLGKRGLYPTIGGKAGLGRRHGDAVDAQRTPTAAPRCWTSPTGPDLDFAQVCSAATDLAGAGLLERAGEHPGR